LPRCSEHLPISYCAIYTRQSIDTRSDFTSCQTQFEVCRNYLKSQQWLGWRWIEERFDDEGYSGATLDRPALQRLLEKVRRGEIDRVLVYSLDRLSRNVIDGLQLLQEFRQRGVALVVATYPELGSAAQDNLIINILSVFAEFERELIRNRIAKVRAALKRQGKRVGGAVPFGYDADPVTKQLVVNPEEGRRVRAMFEMAAEGLLPSGIAEAANQKGWRTKTREAKRTGKMSGGNPWTARQPPGCPSQEQRLLRFSAAWSLLSPESQRQALPRVIREVAWDADTCQVSVVLDEAALERYASKPEEPGKRVRKRTTRGTD